MLVDGHASIAWQCKLHSSSSSCAEGLHARRNCGECTHCGVLVVTLSHGAAVLSVLPRSLHGVSLVSSFSQCLEIALPAFFERELPWLEHAMSLAYPDISVRSIKVGWRAVCCG